MDVYIVNQDNPAAVSAAVKISSAEGGLIPLTEEEFKAYTNDEVYKIPASPAIDNSNSNLQVMPLDFTHPDVNYLIVAQAEKVQMMALNSLKHKFKDKVTIVTTY
jgi:hypothetical protein